MNIATLTWLEIQLLVHITNRRTGRMVGDRGEGVISTAIAVLITAFIGAAMWVAFNEIWGGAEESIREEVETIGG